MELLVTPVPLFDRNLAVEAYYTRYQEGNDLLVRNQVTSEYDGIMVSPLLQILDLVGTEPFSMGKPVFVPVTPLMLLANLAEQCRSTPPETLVFVLDAGVSAQEQYLNRMRALKAQGFRFAMQKPPALEPWLPVIELCDFLMFEQRQLTQPGQAELPAQIKTAHPGIEVVVTDVETHAQFEALHPSGAGLFEGQFYRMPVTKGNNKVSPLKANLINLLNLVQDENFEFDKVAEIVQRDTALTVSLLRMVNSPGLGLRQKVKSIAHAVTILGQLEVRKWVTTAVSKLLGSDKPDELTRLSLQRAKFAENLAAVYGLPQRDAQSLFLTGLFSVLDLVLDVPMEQALTMLQVSDEIRDALLEGKGPYSEPLEFIKRYESADWPWVSRTLIVHDFNMESIYNAYIDALCWYRDLIIGGDVDVENAK